MLVTFTRTGERRYRVAVERADGMRLAMEPAPGYHEYLPHDLVHFVVESHWGLGDGIYGQLAAGGDVHTFRPVDQPRTRRVARAIARRNTPGADVARSEELAARAFDAWLDRQGRYQNTEPKLAGVLERLDELAGRWHALAVGESLTLTWSPAANVRPARRRTRASGGR